MRRVSEDLKDRIIPGPITRYAVRIKLHVQLHVRRPFALLDGSSLFAANIRGKCMASAVLVR
jgi:hypothetical protein